MILDNTINKICEKEPLFSNLVLKLKPIEDKEATPTMGTDGENLYYNPGFLEKLTSEEKCAVVLHEVLHCAFVHPWRKGKRDMMRWNVATDYAINTVVNESFPLPKGCLLDMKYYGMSAEEIYDSLPKSKVKVQSWCDKGKWGKSGGKGKSNGKKSLWEKLFGKKEKSSGKSEKEKEAMWKKLFEDSILKKYGDMPDSMKRLIEKSYYVPVVDWTSLVSQLLSEDTNDYTFSSPDRRFADADFFLPGLYSVDRLKDVVFAYDTSGSISSSDLHAFYMETMNLFSNFSSLQGWIAICDAYLHSFKDIDLQTTYDEFDFQGGGGTSFSPVFEEITHRQMKPKAVFYFTDTEGSFPDEKPDYPVFWLVKSQVGYDNYVPYVPFGEVIRFLPKIS